MSRLEKDEISIEEFQVGLFDLTKKVFACGLLVYGFAYSDYYEQEIRKQINYIDRFGMDIKNGRNFGSLDYRAKLYLLSGIYFFEELTRKQYIKAGYSEKRRVCDNSVFDTEWIRISAQDNIMDGIVGKDCVCRYEFR